MKRILFALAIGVALFVVVAYAANLGVSSGGLQQGYSTVVCDGNGVSVTYQDLNNDGNYEQATVSGIDCSGTYNITVDVQDVANATLAYGTVSTFGSSALVALPNNLLASEIAPAQYVVVTIVQTGP